MEPTARSSDVAAFRHRTADATLTVLDAAGDPVAGREVVVGQLCHAFLFGCTGFEAIPLANGELTGTDRALAERTYDRWFELFNFATLPFYWGRFEPRRGQPDTARLLTAARWFRDRGCRVKGHPLCWHSECADWLLGLSNDEIVEAQRARIRREVTGFAGLIDTWDVVNEAVIMPVFDKTENGLTRVAQELGRVGVVRMAFEAARESNPSATLLLNDFDLSVDYERLIEACLEAGVSIDAIGIQSHMHQGYRGEEWTHGVLERYGRFGLPLHWTESTLVSGHLMPAEIVDLNDYRVDDWPTTLDGEERQADEAVRHYRTLFADPAVAAITWWGLPDGGWLNAPSGLLRADGSTKPAFDALRDLIKRDWWLSPTSMRTDEEGRIRFSGYHGDYDLSWAGQSATFRLERSNSGALEVRLSS